ncbi:uncharacterized protein LOC123305848 isoform X2 [Chrysoperla carnea]|uniref:uncharacterized protein LOC123305848 isoform X2 n=1 Tax=Chrysoperla carnea TaxID=189513 RepID=UPI001D060721|nr:uncharacterized protein LOC123305848 isoform X2 [Chrysoperla carnea]
MDEGECQQNSDDVNVSQKQNTSCNDEAGVQTESLYFYQSEGFGSLDVHFNSSSSLDDDSLDDIQMEDMSAASTSASDENVE